MSQNSPKSKQALPTTALTHRGLADFLGVSETTVKSYRRKFPDCIPVENMGKPIRFSTEASKVCLMIRDLFETGMSVVEIRARLTKEFSWIPEQTEVEKETTNEQNNAEQSPAQTPQEIKNFLSSLSKAMITISQQQNTILKKVQRLEDQAQQEGSNPAANSHFGNQELAPFKPELSECLASYEQKIDSLTQAFNNIPTQLAGMVQDLLAPILGQKLEQMFEQALDKKFQDYNLQNIENTQQAQNRATVVPFPKTQEDSDQEAINFNNNNQPNNDQAPRQLLALPLVVRSLNGEYLSAAGKNKGRFSLNDLKALLAYNSPPPDHYVLRWENDQSGWWFALEQEKSEAPRCLRLLLNELTTHRGEVVVMVTRLSDNGTETHPAELMAFIHKLSALK